MKTYGHHNSGIHDKSNELAALSLKRVAKQSRQIETALLMRRQRKPPGTKLGGGEIHQE
jgi:hypothetical protein